jgi:hypothetical protein
MNNFFSQKGDVRMETSEFRKAVSLLLSVSDWRAVRREAARRRIPMTALCREWLEPDLEQLRQQPPSLAVDEECDADHL